MGKSRSGFFARYIPSYPLFPFFMHTPKGYWLTDYYDLKLRIVQQNQAGFTEKIFLERAGIDLGFPRMLARRSPTELSKLDTSKGKINWI